MATVKVSARIKPEDMDALDSIVSEKKLGTVSKAIREAILEYINDYNETGNKRTMIKISLPKLTIELWEEQRKGNENSQSLQELMVKATEKYIEERRKETIKIIGKEV